LKKKTSDRRSPRQDPPPAQVTVFQRLLQGLLTRTESAGAQPVEPLAHLDYERELSLKHEALCNLWRQHKLGDLPEPVMPSPRPRHYRTTTRRRAHYSPGRLQLGFGDGRGSSVALPESHLEPEAHSAIYRFLVEALATPANRALATHLNHAIIRGSYEAFSVILNLDFLDGSIVRRLKKLSEQLQALPQNILSNFVFCDPSRSDYYFEREAPPVAVRLKKMFGPARFPLRLAGHRYALPPTSFTQVNESMVEPMLGAVRTMLQPSPGDRLLDLYCGFGLFAHDLADTCMEVVGIDVDRDAIAAATEHLRFESPKGRVTFHRRDISAESLTASLPEPGGRELVVLDPPRRGVDPGVITCLAHRRPVRVVHICCGVETIPAAVTAWKQDGYGVTRCLPLDMFAGTPNLEVLMLLEPIG
jgi:tRNA/tmRNA/rRNA uracil-C5-methylase (TrmA/RlmC/RlmD family)